MFSLEEHHSCYRYKSDYKAGFKYNEVKAGESIDKMNTTYHHLIFLRDGLLKISCNEFIDRKIHKEECIMIPAMSDMSCAALKDSSVMVLSFDALQNVCDKVMVHSYRSYASDFAYSFTPIPVRNPLFKFLELMETYLNEGVACEHMHELKQKELFLLLRRCYSRDELLTLLYPIIGISDFKNFILQNYQNVENVGELADMSGMGRTAFDCKFREVFGVSTRQWILKQIAARIQYKIMDPEITIKDIMQEFKFNSASHFNRFCKQQFHCTPGELLKRSREQSEN
ncbi:MAG: AraC family transcriptional regulator [Tannerellaceae bacterium]|nr:AraC family transcriptional regulator [Tannerellaceae bacterium]